MGVKFIKALNGNVIYQCRNEKCLTPVATNFDLISRNFRKRGRSGPAILFENVQNVIKGAKTKKRMLTGEHIVQLVYCKLCGAALGWHYDFTSEGQMYKEGKFVLEVANVKAVSGSLQSVPFGQVTSIV
ncbi:Oidioi.mRNA.OKI2018_I69.XSR.g15577.t1.cds [Oikopleura dioica]|uniref:Protein yippee-like n=1 Tax=Oikopleura dioica TaxID=34765 RepID=A0ABN7SDA7_OIKDI|nr:Oidioi.mRNA.OKI2018_I69.XSR.g15577.t1.cds [Oikopleura dioica]